MGLIRIIYSQKKIASKIHHCYKCSKEIQIGDEYKKVVYSSDGGKYMIKACLGCDIELRMVLKRIKSLVAALEQCKQEVEQFRRLSYGMGVFPSSKGMEMAEAVLKEVRGDA